ncbi:MAG: DUF2752 domain-containing protein [Bacteroidota bacterium]
MKQKLYIVLFIACVAGYGWLYLNAQYPPDEVHSIGFCPVKHFTTIPCPSCGSTRSVLFILDGQFADALLMNPLGYIVALLMLCLPLWILTDLITRKQSLYTLYTKTETYLRKAGYAIPLTALVVLNWIWNITKGL